MSASTLSFDQPGPLLDPYRQESLLEKYLKDPEHKRAFEAEMNLLLTEELTDASDQLARIRVLASTGHPQDCSCVLDQIRRVAEGDWSPEAHAWEEMACSGQKSSTG